jgi:PAS domain S-box-containing protein
MGPAADAILAAALDAVVVMSADGCVRHWNPAAERLFGIPAAEALGREVADLIIPGPLRDAHRNALARHLETGEASILGRRVELVAMHHDGHEISVELTVTALPGHDPPAFAGFLRPLSERRLSRQDTVRLQKRMAFLAQAGLVLDRSLELDETLRRIADLTVPELAQLTIIDLVSEDGALETAVAAALDPGHARELERVRAEHPLGPDSPHPVIAALRSRRPALLSTMSEGFQRQIAQGDQHFALMRRLRYHSAIVVPLLGRHGVLGVLSLLRMEDAPRYDSDDLVLAEDLARRAELAIDNSRLFEATRGLARTLQSSLLPDVLPQIEGVHIAARYRAAAQGQEVGGDFYDVFPVGAERWGLSIGDVRGKGPRAAALTALARYTIRALCDRGAARVLEELGDAVVRDAESLPERFLTAAVAVAERVPGGLDLELAAAGHPPPIVLRRTGRVQPTRAAGMLIGLAGGVRYEPERLSLGAGDTLVLYTDGLTDARAPAHVIGDAELMGLVRRGLGLDAEALAAFLEESVTAGAEPRDDIAVMVVQVQR